METNGASRPPRAPRPRFTLGVLYLFAFFALYCVALVTPALWNLAWTLPPGPAQQEIAMDVAQETIRPWLPLAFVAALLTTAVGMRKGLLPGTRRNP